MRIATINFSNHIQTESLRSIYLMAEIDSAIQEFACCGNWNEVYLAQTESYYFALKYNAKDCSLFVSFDWEN